MKALGAGARLCDRGQYARGRYGATGGRGTGSTTSGDPNATSLVLFGRCAARSCSKIGRPIFLCVDVAYGTCKEGNAAPTGGRGRYLAYYAYGGASILGTRYDASATPTAWVVFFVSVGSASTRRSTNGVRLLSSASNRVSSRAFFVTAVSSRSYTNGTSTAYKGGSNPTLSLRTDRPTGGKLAT